VRPFIPKGPPRYLHQQRGLRDIIRNRGVHALLFDPGLGKTSTVLDYASLLALKSQSEIRVLVIAPLAALDTWVLQADDYIADGIDIWAEALQGSVKERGAILAARGGKPFPQDTLRRLKGDDPRAAGWRKSPALKIRLGGNEGSCTYEGPEALDKTRIVICSVTTDSFSSRSQILGSKTSADYLVDAVKRFAPDLIVLDESHRAKGSSSNTSRAIARLTPLCERRIILTGTVMPHSPMDVFGQWRFLDPTAFATAMADGSRRPFSFGRFKERYAVLGGWQGKQVVGFKNLDEMQEIMAQRSTVATKDTALDLPPTTTIQVPVNLSPAEKKAYADMKKQLATQLDSGALATVPNRLAQMMRLRQITSGFIKNDGGQIETLGESKAKAVQSLVQDSLIGEKRIVVFAQFTHEIGLLTRLLADANTEVFTITGSTKAAERGKIRARFGSDDPQRMVIVAQIKTLSLGVNELVTASHAIFASLSQRRDDFIQARDRLDRIGQTRPVTFWEVVVPNSVDTVILTAHRDRTSLEDGVVKHIMNSRNNF